MYYSTKTIIPWGSDGKEITIEIDSNRSLPTIDIIGLPDSAVKESRERLRAAFRYCEIDIPPRKFVINMAPSDIKKTGTIFDLAIGVALLVCIYFDTAQHKDMLQNAIFFGELGLDGSIKGVQGILPAVIAGMRRGYNMFFVPAENIGEVEYMQGITLYSIQHFQEIVDMCINGKITKQINHKDHHGVYNSEKKISDDFGTIRGNHIAKRALAIAATGMHNVLLIGPPGTGKTMLAKAVSSILPPLSFSDIIEVSQIYSLVGRLSSQQPLIYERPFRSVHHTASKIAIIGGGQHMMPGEISLAHKGILFFDEVPEFPRGVLDVLRQPLEDKVVTISRALGTVNYPTQCMFIGAMNPCVCGYFRDTQKICTCAPGTVKKYQSRVSGPLLDRIDMILEIPRQKDYSIIEEKSELSSTMLREHVMIARERQQRRFAGTNINTNAGIDAKDMNQYIILNEECDIIVKRACEKLHLSLRAVHRLLKLSRSIADFSDKDTIEKEDVLEALQYRGKTMFIEGD